MTLLDLYAGNAEISGMHNPAVQWAARKAALSWIQGVCASSL